MTFSQHATTHTDTTRKRHLRLWCNASFEVRTPYPCFLAAERAKGVRKTTAPERGNIVQSTALQIDSPPCTRTRLDFISTSGPHVRAAVFQTSLRLTCSRFSFNRSYHLLSRHRCTIYWNVAKLPNQTREGNMFCILVRHRGSTARQLETKPSSETGLYEYCPKRKKGGISGGDGQPRTDSSSLFSPDGPVVSSPTISKHSSKLSKETPSSRNAHGLELEGWRNTRRACAAQHFPHHILTNGCPLPFRPCLMLAIGRGLELGSFYSRKWEDLGGDWQGHQGHRDVSLKVRSLVLLILSASLFAGRGLTPSPYSQCRSPISTPLFAAGAAAEGGYCFLFSSPSLLSHCRCYLTVTRISDT